MTNRKTAICLDGQTKGQKSIQIEVPQDSIVVPILFILFTTSLFKLFSNKKKEIGISIRGYVDDGFLTIRHKSIQTSVSKIALDFKKVEQRVYDNRMFLTWLSLRLSIFSANAIFLI